MTTAPNIEMIASSLRHCSLNGGRRRAGSRGGRSRGGDSESDVTIELNSDVALPFHWEQCLDIRVRSISAHTDSVSFVPRARARPPGREGVRDRERARGLEEWFPNHLVINGNQLPRYFRMPAAARINHSIINGESGKQSGWEISPH
jgi:hypothetical protein